MVYQPPAGARDLLPLDVAQKSWIEDRLQQVYHRWGYHRIITSTLERLDTLMAGGAIQRSTVIQIQDAEEGTLGLRPELTASIARASVTRMAGVSYPQRLYYNANVFRRSQGSNYGRQQEFYQAGVELLGAGGVLADAEVLLLLGDCLKCLGLSQWQVILGEAGLTRSLFSPFPVHLQEKVRRAIAHLDRITLETLPLSPELRERALFLFELRGHPADVLQRVSTLDLAESERQTVNNLKSLIDLLNEGYSHQQSFPVTLDLSLIQTFNYYTGIVFEVVSDTDTQARVLAQGGRYDQLLGLYHPQGQTYPSIGFALNIEDLYQVLLSKAGMPRETPASDWLVVPASPQAYMAAFAHAQTLRDSIHLVRVEMDLGGRSPEDVREYARSRHIRRIAWVEAEGATKIETLS
ncbi:ATP phosphoribosyltransferase regulatory subunit [Coleofasciculus sp. FACHB-1120]|uniref:ATP phosphoribosyltransferase regulatory subunit n=1 Tax=Coleofasciculus sp. FACHB-1120 TaxID=2692783 RepID=UPI001689A9AC|nr:ATP phosphoribosyltransferase regulatory subunit [Coleofasciculus sp. FACHB-1120]MBD2742680.1 ATP phosphoribosyltransferase regulatory subunit [Coleofasciculus sp. FACHB-1120]